MPSVVGIGIVESLGGDRSYPSFTLGESDQKLWV